ncbi:OLC1v1020016C2 [Oldenlandia corymbosa var. corymbosa]|uniref:OLC1v1020016C2 n=1 Tax=Oldenlandia corymbosa var. corymbosa TaxID=529605 RepID=A0AAV1EFI8_OLDCO|nr:OLC1v1020016C2 [Oldenlandia corymbosa var. corymbosa]
MKSLVLTPNSSTKSSASTTTATSSAASVESQSETRDSFYFPGCRKDANCNCEMCIESMNATLDLMPQSGFSSLTKFSVSKPVLTRSPVKFNPSLLSTPIPESKNQAHKMSPPLDSKARLSFQKRVDKRKREFRFGVSVMRFFLAVCLILAAEFGFSWVVSGVFQPQLSKDIVRNLAEKSRVLGSVNERVSFLNQELWSHVDEATSDCPASEWKIVQDGLLLNSRNVLYSSMTEEVSIWGWPLQTAGLLTAEFSSRLFTILSGRVTEWTNGEVGYLIRESNSSWVQGKWSASAVQFDPDTWILEYKQSPMLENARLVSATFEFLKFRLVRELKHLQQEFWLLFAFGNQFSDLIGTTSNVPT